MNPTQTEIDVVTEFKFKVYSNGTKLYERDLAAQLKDSTQQ